MVFNQNNVRQLYVAKSYAENLAANSPVGTITVKKTANGDKIYFQHVGAGGKTRSDEITIKNITNISVTDANSLAHPMLRYKVILDPNVNGGAPVAAQDYILDVDFKKFIGMSDEDKYNKYGMVHAVTGMTASTFYKTLALSLAKNFSREVVKLVSIYLETGGTKVDTAGTLAEVTNDTKESALTGTYTGIVIEESMQDWQLGLVAQEYVDFEVKTDKIKVSGDELTWGSTAKLASASKIYNGHLTADLEWFCMGKRADVYRNVGYPNILPTTYLVDPALKYNYIDVNYAFAGVAGTPHEDLQAPKTITLVVPKVGDKDSVSNVLTNSIVTALATATGLTIKTLNVVDA
jgi:hypothetical protein